MSDAWVRPATLEGVRLRVIPTTPDHVADLHAATDPDTFRLFTTKPRGWSEEAMLGYLREFWDRGQVVQSMQIKETGAVVGCSSFFDYSEEHRRLEIGYTWIHHEWRGTFVNPEAKLLMIGHAIESLGANRVQLKTDERNLQSQNAMRKLGLQFEGFLRNHMVMPDGFIRNTAMFSVIPSEWPTMKTQLLARLGYTAADWELVSASTGVSSS
ncbi:MAG: hypothetical protein HONBIEJF_00137 [Fimbriimonadaceae bacterium]|nr:hypothetical protein [Fimbriimonadaceae bacterium]